MPVNQSQVQVGRFFVTPGPNSQLRKVTAMPLDSQSRVRVEYVAKSAKLKGRAFAPAGTKANPALLNTFANACDRVLSAADVSSLRTSNVILPNE
jgi:hypothetical protein